MAHLHSACTACYASPQLAPTRPARPAQHATPRLSLHPIGLLGLHSMLRLASACTHSACSACTACYASPQLAPTHPEAQSLQPLSLACACLGRACFSGSLCCLWAASQQPFLGLEEVTAFVTAFDIPGVEVCAAA